ncbi:MAG TPA: 4'-phosphopantetheinyl transferase superfamily protein [Nitrobacter sp.]|nr:4'-phosphopantetheinyl transferase superfamily protein [Nitrobacter sp.]
MPSPVCDQALETAAARVAPPGLLVGCRRIEPHDAGYLLPEERESITVRAPVRRAASGTARRIAHDLLRRMGQSDVAVLRGSAGEPLWPRGIVGSIAHDDEMAVAAAAGTDAFGSVGIDIETAEPLPRELERMVSTPSDRLDGLDPRLAGRILFAAKEAVYKAAFPLDRQMLGFEDISVDFQSGRAATSTGRCLRLVFIVTSHVLTLAFTRVEEA